MMRPVVFINGPPGSGKDSLAIHIAHHYLGFHVVKFAQILKERTHALYGRSDIPHDWFEPVKDKPNDLFFGLTPRQAYISVSENLIKPNHGKDIYGKLLARKLQENAFAKAFVISDLGFYDEAVPVMEGSSSALLIRLHAEGRGCTFEGDSRSYIKLPIETLDFTNNGTITDFLRSVDDRLSHSFQQMVGGN